MPEGGVSKHASERLEDGSEAQEILDRTRLDGDRKATAEEFDRRTASRAHDFPSKMHIPGAPTTPRPDKPIPGPGIGGYRKEAARRLLSFLNTRFVPGHPENHADWLVEALEEERRATMEWIRTALDKILEEAETRD